MPTFQGTEAVEDYLAWELKVDKLFRMNRYSDQRKLDLAVAALDGYAAAWWERCVQQRMEFHEPRVATWDELKRQMRARFVPHNYKRSLYEKLVGLKQGSKTVDEYYKEMETIIIHADVRETQEQTMACFNAGLNYYSIKRIVSHHSYSTMVELMHQAREAEKQVIEDTKYATRQRYSQGSPSSYNKATPAGHSTQLESSSVARGSAGKMTDLFPPSSRRPVAPATSGASSMGSSARARDKECHKCKGLGHFMKDCPNKKVMILTDFPRKRILIHLLILMVCLLRRNMWTVDRGLLILSIFLYVHPVCSACLRSSPQNNDAIYFSHGQQLAIKFAK